MNTLLIIVAILLTIIVGLLIVVAFAEVRILRNSKKTLIKIWEEDNLLIAAQMSLIEKLIGDKRELKSQIEKYKSEQ